MRTIIPVGASSELEGKTPPHETATRIWSVFKKALATAHDIKTDEIEYAVGRIERTGLTENQQKVDMAEEGRSLFGMFYLTPTYLRFARSIELLKHVPEPTE